MGRCFLASEAAAAGGWATASAMVQEASSASAEPLALDIPALRAGAVVLSAARAGALPLGAVAAVALPNLAARAASVAAPPATNILDPGLVTAADLDCCLNALLPDAGGPTAT